MSAIQENPETDLSTNGWDRTFLHYSSVLAEPICSVYKLVRYRLFAPLEPNKFDHCTTTAREVGYRSLIVSGVCLGAYLFAAMPLPMTVGVIALGGGSKLLRAIGFSLQKEGYTHVLGKAPEKTIEGSVKIMNVMNWNVCGIAGGFHYDHGGVIDWQSRLNGIVRKIETEDPDVVVLEEIYDGALGEALISRLENKYAHFYFHLGQAVMGSVGGLMVLSKCAVHQFTNTDFSTNNWKLKRGFASLEIKASPEANGPIARIIGTHLIHGDEEKDRNMRVKQVAQIVDHIARQRFSLPTILTGDFNIERDGEEGEILHPYLRHGYLEKKPTCTNRLSSQWDLKSRSVWNETIDYISLFKERASVPVVEKGIEFIDCHLSLAYDEKYDTQTALSDHQALVATIRLGNQTLARKQSI